MSLNTSRFPAVQADFFLLVLRELSRLVDNNIVDYQSVFEVLIQSLLHPMYRKYD